MTRVALIQLAGREAGGEPQHYLDNALAAIVTAGKQNVDLIVLPEAVNLGPGEKYTYRDVAMPLTALYFEKLAALAKKYHTYVIFPFIEAEGGDIFNTALILDRDGNKLGKYHKVHEPRVVIAETGVRLGHSFPVFRLDFGRIGILICYDTITPEPALIYGLQHVDAIIFPHLILPDASEYFHIMIRSWALDSVVRIFSCGWGRTDVEAALGPLAPTCIIEPDGCIAQQLPGNQAGMLIHELDFRSTRITTGLGVRGAAEWRRVFRDERRPHLYGKLLETETDEQE